MPSFKDVNAMMGDMRRQILVVFLGLGLTACGESASGGLTKLWELPGFENPESVLPSADASVLYVSNVTGAPDKKDGVGFISKMSPDGKMITLKWVEGLDAPKGMALHGGKLYVSDIDQLVEIDVAGGKVANRYPGAGAKFFNDLAVDKDGRIYVSDMAANKIWRLDGGKFEVWLDSAALKNPNGLLVQGDNLIVAAWGVMTDGFATKVPGNLLTVSLADKSVKDLGNGKPVGNLDGLEPFHGDYLVSDWMVGKVFKITAAGDATLLAELKPGTADLGYIPATRMMFLPMMNDGKVVAYKME